MKFTNPFRHHKQDHIHSFPIYPNRTYYRLKHNHITYRHHNTWTLTTDGLRHYRP